MRQWESQPLPGVLEDDAPMSLSMSRKPQETIDAISQHLEQMYNVSIPDWLETEPRPESVYAVHLAFEYWRTLIDNMDRKLVRWKFGH